MGTHGEQCSWLAAEVFRRMRQAVICVSDGLKIGIVSIPQAVPVEEGLAIVSQWLERATEKSTPSASSQVGPNTFHESPSSQPTAQQKKSTQKGEGEAKLIAALTEHHKYGNGACGNTVAVGNNALARKANVVKRTASAFFTKHFKGHDAYLVLCRDPYRLIASLKLMNGEYRPHHFSDTRIPDKVKDGDD